jgi:sugar phosphate isomerase/epimerase
MRRCFSTLGCPDLSLEEVLGLAHRHGFDAVELRALEGTIDLPGLFRRRYGSPDELARRLADAPEVRIAVFDTSFHLVGGSANERGDLLAFAPWALALGVPWLRVFDGGSAADDASLAEAGRTLAWWAETRAREGWPFDLAIETHDSLGTAGAVRRLLAAAPGARMLWDAHNMWRLSGEDPAATLAAIAPHVVHVHVKDSISRPSGPRAYTYVLPGQGEFPMAAVAAGLRERGFDGCVSLEWEKLWHPALGPLDTAIEAAAAAGWW